ncbi:MAG: response regulator [Oleiphilus sp.]
MIDKPDYRPILLVEDNPIDLDLMLRAIKKHNMVNDIQVARDGDEALDYLPKWEQDKTLPCVILLDLKLPKVSGLDVLKQLKSNPVSASIPVVILTSSSEDKDIETAYALNANSYIVKPVSFDKFVEVAKQIELYWVLLNESPRKQ